MATTVNGTSVNYGSAAWDEDAFVRAFEACEYPPEKFRHADHIRLAWIYVRRYGLAGAEERIRMSIRNFATSVGHAPKYHETMTRAWLRLVYAAYAATPGLTDYVAFVSQHPTLLDKSALAPFYSPQVLTSDEARHNWILPDLKPLPAPVDNPARATSPIR
ncbi:MAG TPA: hypothetical protein VE994_04200 [Terriglobales bacterium]|nr:hypothetical protein [Terriglobales bacterium]